MIGWKGSEAARQCVSCLTHRPQTDFYPKWKGSTDRHNICCECHRTRQREYARRCRARKRSEAPPEPPKGDWRDMASELARGDLKGKPLSIHVRVGGPSFKAVVKHLVESGLLDNPERWTDP